MTAMAAAECMDDLEHLRERLVRHVSRCMAREDAEGARALMEDLEGWLRVIDHAQDCLRRYPQ